MKKITIEDIRLAYEHIKDDIEQTPFTFSRNCSKVAGSDIYLKFENHQRTGSFKIRGALNKMRSLTGQEKANGVIASSAGNHAQGVALAASIFGVKSKIVMPKNTPIVKVQATAAYGGEVILHGDIYDESYQHALKLADEQKLTFVHPYDDAHIIAGQGTIGLELYEDIPDLDTVVVSLGGGGLISGIGLALKTLNPKIKIIGVTPANSPGMEYLYNDKGDEFKFKLSIADGTAIRTPNKQIFKEYISEYVDEIVTVTEDEIAEAVVFLLERAKTVVEGSGALGLAAVMHRKLDVGKKCGLILCGGNIDLNLMNKAIDRGLAKAGRIARISALTSDKPGELMRLTEIMAQSGANILDVEHDRLDPDLSIRETKITFVVEAKDQQQIESLIESIRAAGARVKN